MAHKVYINYNDVQQFVQQIVAPIKEDHIKTWFNKKLSHYLMSNYPNVTALKMPAVHTYFKHQDLPVVIQKAVENNETIYRFKKSAALKTKSSQIVDYLKHLQSTNTNITGMPFDVAVKQSDKWHESFGKSKKKVTANIEGLNIITTFDNGAFLAQLVSKEQFAYESKLMAHCVQSYYDYGRDHSKILTYRTEDNKPLLTMEVIDNKAYVQIVQAKGFANKGFIPEEHIQNVLHYFHSLKKTVAYSDCLIFGHMLGDKPVIMMPEGSVFAAGKYEMEVEFNCCVGIPKNAVFNNTLRLTDAQLPILSNITIHGDLIIENSLIVAIMDTVHVTGTIRITQSLTSIIAPHLQSKVRRY